MNVTTLTPRASIHLDMLRGVSALAVLLGHVRGLYFLDHRDLPGKSISVDCLYAATGLGHQAVMVFFVLSGFFIGGSVLSTIGSWSWKRYLVSRLCRLYLVLIPALVLTAGADYFARRLPSGPIYYDRAIPHFNVESIESRSNVATFVGNALFLQTIKVKPFGSNSPLWSLANEFWYYILFPVLAMLLFAPNGVTYKAGLFLAACALFVWIPKWFLPGLVVWLLGAAMHFLPNRVLPNRPLTRLILTMASAAAFFTALKFSRGGTLPAMWSDLAVGGTFALWLYCIVKIHREKHASTPGYASTAALLSKCSHSVYATHIPLVLLIRTALGTSLWAPTPRNLVLAGGIASAVFLFGLAFSRLTEAHTDAARTRLLRLLVPEPVRTPEAVSV
ncbi:MAG TPA: acyltransferase [Bryobacteraceae bacterium]|nr:acyltransferase [Bryobacteraceae bacterium]